MNYSALRLRSPTSKNTRCLIQWYTLYLLSTVSDKADKIQVSLCKLVKQNVHPVEASFYQALAPYSKWQRFIEMANEIFGSYFNFKKSILIYFPRFFPNNKTPKRMKRAYLQTSRQLTDHCLHATGPIRPNCMLYWHKWTVTNLLLFCSILTAFGWPVNCFTRLSQLWWYV